MTTFGTNSRPVIQHSNGRRLEFLLFGSVLGLQLAANLAEFSAPIAANATVDADCERQHSDQLNGHNQPDGEPTLVWVGRVVLARLLETLHESVGQVINLFGLIGWALLFGELNPTVPELPSAATLDTSGPFARLIYTFQIRPSLLFGLLVTVREVFVDQCETRRLPADTTKKWLIRASVHYIEC